MFPRRFVFVVVAFLVVFGIFGAIGSSMRQDAWMQGYLMGQLSAGKEGAANPVLAPYLYRGFGGFGGPHFGVGPFGFIFPLLFIGLVIFGVSRACRYAAWRRGGGQGSGPWGGHHGWHGQQPPAGGEGRSGGSQQPGGPWGWHGPTPPGWGQAPSAEPKTETGSAEDRPRNASYV